MRMRHIFICALYDSTFPQYLINGKIFEKKKLLNTNCVFWFYNTTYVWNISHFKKNWSFFFILIEDIAPRLNSHNKTNNLLRQEHNDSIRYWYLTMATCFRPSFRPSSDQRS